MTSSELGWLLAGKTNVGHGVIDTNLDNALAEEVARRLDFPRNLPSGVDEVDLKAVGAFALDDHFVFFSIAPDENVSRAGMARTGAIVLPLTDVTEVNDPAEYIRMADSVQKTAGQQSAVTTAPALKACAPLIDRLLEGDAFVSTRIDARLLLRSLWSALPRDLRSEVVVRLCFSDDDLPDGKIALGFMPDSVKWTLPPGMWVDTPFGVPTKQSEPVTVILTDPASDELEDFIRSAGFGIASMKQLGLVERIRSIAMNSEASRSQLISALRFSISLPDAGAKADFEQDLMKRIAGHNDDLTPDEILAMRNLTPHSTPKLLQGAISNWVFAQLKINKSRDFHSAISEVWNEKTAGWWKEAWKKAFKKHKGVIPVWLAEFITSLLAQCSNHALEVIELLGNSRNLDATLAAAVAKRPPQSFDPFSQIMPAEAFPQTNVAGLLGSSSEVAKVMEHITSTMKEGGPKLAEIVVDQIEISDIPSFLKHDDDLLLGEYIAVRIIDDPAPLRGSDLRNYALHRTLAHLIAASEAAVGDTLRNLVDDTLTIVLAGNTLEPDFANAVAAHDAYDLLDHKKRAELWEALPQSLADALLTRTAKRWIENVNELADLAIEKPLRSAIAAPQLAPDRRAALPTADLGGWVALAGFEKRIDYETKSRLEQVLRTSTTLEPSDVTAMAALIADRQASDIARQLVRQYHGKPSLRPAWPLLRPMLGFWDTLLLPNVSFSQKDWDDALQNILCELYPEGPTEDLLWEEIGGRMSDVTGQKNGRAGWRAAFRRISNGGPVTRDNLLRYARSDNPNNANLRALDGNRP